MAEPSNPQTPGSWMDEWGSCKVCGGEIPEGHAVECDVWKLQMQVERLTRERDQATAIVGELAALVPLSETIEATRTGRTLIDWFKSRLMRALPVETTDSWQPIETYEALAIRPIDVLVAVPPTDPARGHVVGEARWHEDERGWWWAGNDPTDSWGGQIDPTHWRPMPTAPPCCESGRGARRMTEPSGPS